jgi:SMC interacting uncharacterized protein involved in chromosome segregation
MGEDMTNGRVTTREFYEKLERVEQRLITRLDSIDTSVQANCVMLEGIKHDIDKHEKELDAHQRHIDSLRDSAKQAGVISSIIAIVGSTIAAILGVRS